MKNPRGFTLIEALVALAVVTVALGAALRAGAAMGDQHAALRLRILADWVAADRVAALRGGAYFPDAGISNGTADQGGERFHWRQTVTATPQSQFRRVAVEVASQVDAPALANRVMLLRSGGTR